MKLYLVRHGETQYNVQRRSTGQVNPPLNKKGKREAQLLAELLEVVNFDMVYSSDLRRTMQTTREIMKYQTCPVRITKVLREQNYGLYDGKPYEKLEAYIRESMRTNPDRGYYETPLPKGESAVQAMKRIVRFVDLIYKRHPHDTVLLSTHGRIKRMLIGYLEGLPLSDFGNLQRFRSCSLTIIEFDEKKRHTITLLNHTKHLDIMDRTNI